MRWGFGQKVINDIPDSKVSTPINIWQIIGRLKYGINQFVYTKYGGYGSICWPMGKGIIVEDKIKAKKTIIAAVNNVLFITVLRKQIIERYAVEKVIATIKDKKSGYIASSTIKGLKKQKLEVKIVR